MDFKPEPYNKPLDTSGSDDTSKAQSSVPGDKKVTIM